MKMNFVILFLILNLALIGACSKPGIKESDSKESYTKISEIPDKLFTGGEFYGVWRLNKVKTLSGHYYNGEGNVQFAFTNDGKIVIENTGNNELNHIEAFAPDWKISPWYFKTGTHKFELKMLNPSNEFSIEDGYPLTATFHFTEGKEHWTAHFSDQKIWLYQWASGNAQVHLWAEKVK